MHPCESQQGSIQSPMLKPAARVETNQYTHGLIDMAGPHFCPLFSFGFRNCLQKAIAGFPPLQVDIDDRTKCNLSCSNETRVLRRVSRLYHLVLDLEKEGQNPSFACSFSCSLLDHMEECPHF